MNTDAADDDNTGTALYAPHQTLLYVAPPVVNGQIPKNVYGNLDVYAPSMVPPGGIHIPHPDTARAARIVGIDYADAVTGFSFKGRHGTAITSGAVVGVEYRDAVEEVIKAFEDEQAQAEDERRSLAALRMWKRFLAGLRIRERIEGYDIEGERDTAMRSELDNAEDEEENEGGGFFPDRDAEEPTQLTAKTMLTRDISNLANDDDRGGFCAGSDEQDEIKALHGFDRFINKVNDDDDHHGGGFQTEHDEHDFTEALVKERSTAHISMENVGQGILDQGGGFLPEDDDSGKATVPVDGAIKSPNSVGGILDKNGSIDQRDTPENEIDEAFRDQPAGELEEAEILQQQLYESHGPETLPVFGEDVSSRAPSESRKPPLMRETTAGGERGTFAHLSEAYSGNGPLAEGGSAPDSSEEDKGSLLSHDPNDEDADPEWLA